MSSEGAEVSSFFSIILSVSKLSILLSCLVFSACSTAKIQPQSDSPASAVIRPDVMIMPDGYQLPYTFYPVPESTARDNGELSERQNVMVIALHGFNDYRTAFVDLCTYLSVRGVECIAYDQRGFGQTQHLGIWPEAGRLQADLKSVIVLLRDRYPDRELILVGESMGGAVIITAQEQYPDFMAENVTRSVLLAPAVWGRDTQPWYQRWLLWLAVRTFPSWQPTGEGLGIQATDNLDALRAMGRDPLVIKKTRIDAIYGLNNLMDQALAAIDKQVVNTLYFYGEKDEVIPKNATCAALEKVEAVQRRMVLRTYPKGYHMLSRDLQREQVFRDLVDLSFESEVKAFSVQVERFCRSG
jgi:acylglycerol lipase